MLICCPKMLHCKSNQLFKIGFQAWWLRNISCGMLEKNIGLKSPYHLSNVPIFPPCHAPWRKVIGTRDAQLKWYVLQLNLCRD